MLIQYGLCLHRAPQLLVGVGASATWRQGDLAGTPPERASGGGGGGGMGKWVKEDPWRN